MKTKVKESVIVLQCFCKPVETIKVLESLEKCDGIRDYNLLLFIDKAKDEKFIEKNDTLIREVKAYKKNKNKAYKSITIKKSKKALGPYLACYYAMQEAFKKNQFVIFSEDDIVFCEDSLILYNHYRDNKIATTKDCLGITSTSLHFYPEKNIFSSKSVNIAVEEKYMKAVNAIREKVVQNKLEKALMKMYWAPNKQMGMFESEWNKIKHLRKKHDHEKFPDIAPDQVTGHYVSESNWYFVAPIVPRSNDVGLFNELGCTSMYFDGEINLSTIKYLTSNDFQIDPIMPYDFIEKMPVASIIGSL